jgi:adenylate cyclase
VEIERKFLLEQLPPDTASATSALRQGYLVIGDDGEARIRDAGGAYTLTVKSRGSLSREEYEIPLSRNQFDALWPATYGRRIEKIRHEIELHGMTAEVDIFEGDLDGLILVEVEFASVPAAHEFVPPPWFGREVTADPSYKNASLAVRGRPGGASGVS